MKFKILGMAILALAATSALAVTNASGTANGHFYHHAVGEKAAITANDGEGTAHELRFTRLSAGTHNTTGSPITCKNSEYTGEVSTRTNSVIQVYPAYRECTTVENGTAVTVTTNGCSYTFSAQGNRKHGTVNIDCPGSLGIEIHHPNCTSTVPAQTASASTLTEGISYTNVKEGGVDTVTAHVTVNTIQGHFEGGICVFLGTNHKFEMKGSVTVRGFEYVKGEAKNHTLVHGAAAGITST